MLRGIIAAALVLVASAVSAQGLPQCVIGGTYTDGTGKIFYCTGNATAQQMTTTAELNTAISGVSGGVPAGMIALSLSACPTGWGEVSALNGVMLRGTLAASGNVGTTGGADSRTPAGTLTWPVGVPTFTGSSATSSAVSGGTPAGTNSAPAFTGSALATHAHELPFQVSSTTATRQIAAATFGTGTSRAATGASAAGSSNTTSAAVALSQAVSGGTPAGTVAAPTFTGSALSTHTHTLTATGTNAWPAGVPTFAGAALDVRPAYVNVIFCAKQ